MSHRLETIHTLIIIPGLSNNTKQLYLATKHYRYLGLEPIIFSCDWENPDVHFETILKQLIKLVDSLVKKGKIVSLVGTSAGGSAAINAFAQRTQVIHRAIIVCSRVSVGNAKGMRSFERRTKSSSSFAESVIRCQKAVTLLSKHELGKIMTISAGLGDELVPRDTSTIPGAQNVMTCSLEHTFSISLSMVFPRRIVSFLHQGT